MVALLALLARVFGAEHYQSFYYLTACCLPVTVWAGYHITREIFPEGENSFSARIAASGIWFSHGHASAFLLCEFAVRRSDFVCGIMVMALLIIRYCRTDRIYHLVILLPIAAVSVQIRENTLIFLTWQASYCCCTGFSRENRGHLHLPFRLAVYAGDAGLKKYDQKLTA